jgi:hypothetical protein
MPDAASRWYKQNLQAMVNLAGRRNVDFGPKTNNNNM